nr:hypothetical protein [Paenibacillus xylanexedens]
MTKKSVADKPLSRRQQEVYDFIADFIDSHGYGPSIREIADAFMFVTSTAFKHVETLINKGYLNHKAGGVRTLSLTEKSGRRIAMVSQAGIMDWIKEKMTTDPSYHAILSQLQANIESGAII